MQIHDARRKYPALNFGDKPPYQRGREAFLSGLQRSQIMDREFWSMLSNLTPSKVPNFTVAQLEDQSVRACRDWVLGWDDAHDGAAQINEAMDRANP